MKLPPEVIIDASRIFHPEDEDVLQDYDGIEEHERIRLDDWSDQTDEETNILRINLTNIFLRFLIEKLGLFNKLLKNCPKLSKTEYIEFVYFVSKVQVSVKRSSVKLQKT